MDRLEAQKKQEIGRRVRAWRELRKYTREQLSELSGLSPRFIANVEAGDSSISIDTLVSLCQSLSCSSDSLLFGEEINPEAWKGEIARLQNFPIQYQPQIRALLQSVAELILSAETKSERD